MKIKIALFLIFLVGLWLAPVSAFAGDETIVPEKAYIKGLRGHQQRYSLSCESRSAVDWAAFWGVEISENKFLKRLPRSDNPEKGFVGDPADQLGQVPPASYGVHAEPVAALLREFGLQAQAHRNAEWPLLQSEISSGRPVIVWVIGQMWKGTPVRYTSSDGERTIVAPYEHTMILVGYTPKKVIAIDPATGSEQVYALQDFLNSWKVLGNMAITTSNQDEENVINVEEEPDSSSQVDEAPQPSLGEQEEGNSPTTAVEQETLKGKTRSVYVVKRGEYLIGIARKIGVNWRELASLNHLTAPYILYTGQKLRLP